MKEVLRSLGLTDNEIEIYLYLLKNPRVGGSEIRKATGIANSRVYSCIDEMINKGFLNYEIVSSGRVFSSVNPEEIKEIARERMKKVEEILPQLKEMQKSQKAITNSTVYEGYAGFKNAFYRFIRECPTGETVRIIGFSNQAYKNEKLRFLLSDINKKSKEKKHKFKMILDNKYNVFFRDRKLEGISEIKFMNKGFQSPAAVDIFGDYVFIFIWDETPYAIVIQNKGVAEGFKHYFNFLWGISSK